MRIPDAPRARQTLTHAAPSSVRGATARAYEAPLKAATSAAATVTISAEARRLSVAAGPMDPARVTRLREAMASNTYVVQPMRIAQSLLTAAPA
jgi:anti-sigma28 factor (negative regulator of flagellin synthesis)